MAETDNEEISKTCQAGTPQQERILHSVHLPDRNEEELCNKDNMHYRISGRGSLIRLLKPSYDNSPNDSPSVSALKKRNHLLGDQIKELNHLYKDKIKQIKSMSESADRFERVSKERHCTELSKKDSIIQELNTKIVEIEQKVSNLELKLTQLNAEKNKDNAERKDLLQQLKKKEKEMEKLNESLVELAEKYDANITNAKVQNDGNENDLTTMQNEQIEEYWKRIEELSKEVAQRDALLEKLQLNGTRVTEGHDLKEMNNEWMKKYEDVNEKYRDSLNVIQELRKQFDESIQNTPKCSPNMRQFNFESEVMTEKYLNESKENEENKRKIVAMEKEIKELKQKLEKVEFETEYDDDDEEKTDSMPEPESADLGSLTPEEQTQIQSIRGDMQRLEQIIERLTHQKNDLSSNLDNLMQSQ